MANSCDKHEDVLNKMSRLETEMLDRLNNISKELSRVDTEVKNGWKVIRKNENSISQLDKTAAQSQEQTKMLFKMVEAMSNTVKSIDDKLDMYINDVRKEMKDTLGIVNDLKTNLAVNTQVSKFNLELNWKTIGAIGVVAIAILNVVLGNM